MRSIRELNIYKLKDQIFICSRCSYCREIYKEKENTYTICPIRENTAGFETYIAKGRLMILQGIIDGILDITPRTAEIFFMCTTCGNCKIHCPSGIDTHRIFETFRRDLQELELGLPVHMALGEYILNNNNPYNENKMNRLNWIPNNETTYVDRSSDTMYFVGCTSSYRSIEIARSFYSILKKCGFDFTILSGEICCGSPMFRTGNIETARICIEKNIELFNEFGIKKIITTCAGCLKTLTNDYKHLLGDIKVINYLKVLNNLIKDGKIRFVNDNLLRATYHDPCHSTKGLAKQDYETPRKIIQSVPNVEFMEMKSNRRGSICCGAGGGLKSAYPDLALKIGSKRIEEALETGAEYLISSCPFCKRNLADVAATFEGTEIKVIDIVELIYNRMK